MVDTTHVEVPRATGTYECSGVVKHNDGSRARGYKWATLRTLVDHAGVITQGGLCPASPRHMATRSIASRPI